MWKIFNIESGKILKAGFEDEDTAKEWLEARDVTAVEDFAIEEMDQDEEEEWRENGGEEDEEDVADDDEDAYDPKEFGDDDIMGGDYDEDEDEESEDEEEYEEEDED